MSIKNTSSLKKQFGKGTFWKKVLLYGGLSTFLLGFIFSFFASLMPGIGISGAYLCYSNDSGSNEGKVIERLVVSLDNTCKREIFFDGVRVLDDPIEKKYFWKVRYSGLKSSDEATSEDIGVYSNFQFSFETEGGLSIFQYYFFPKDKRFCAKEKRAICKDGLAWFDKE